MKPEYVNVFIISNNSGRKEIVLTLCNEYQEFGGDVVTKIMQGNGSLGQDNVQNEIVSRIILSADFAHRVGLALLESAREMLDKPGN